MAAITLEEIVEAIKEVLPELKEVPVYFNDEMAKYHGPYFGITEEDCFAIYPDEEIDNPMFDIVDFIGQEHLSLYRVGLPEESMILEMKNSLMGEYFKYVWNKENFNIVLNDLTKKIFIILHEFGHAHELYVMHKCNVESYISNERIYRKRIPCNDLESMLQYKELSIEKYADNVVFSNIEKVFKKLIFG